MAVIKIVPMPGAKGDQGDQGPSGAQGPQGETGEQGPAGADALWSYNGEWQSDATYAEGDVVTYDGQTYYATGITTLGTTPDADSNFDLIAAKGADGSDVTNTDINNAIGASIEYNPVWSDTTLAYTGDPATGYYTRIGNIVFVQIDVDFDNVSDFGSGQYRVTLPFNSRFHTDVYGGSIHDQNAETRHWSIKGHLIENSNVCTLWYISSSSEDKEFDFNSPVTLTTADKFHMWFMYECID